MNPAPPRPPAGRIDLHSHLLPGLDDGCRNLADSLACVRGLLAMGYRGAACTPHFWPAQFPAVSAALVAERVAALQRAIDREKLLFRVWPGGEVRLFEDADKWMNLHGFPILGGAGGGRTAVLIDSWRGDWPRHCDRTVDAILARGLTPVLAHPERSPTRFGFGRLLDRLARRGVLLQGNLRSFGGGEGPRALSLARSFLRDGRYACVASDTHRAEGIQDRRRGLEALADETDADTLRRLTTDAPRRLLNLDAEDAAGG
ncbi:tyrosine-protein phosphatase [Phycisphaera mikurensis]|uniref:protein-tyrosine-phosphatase n=1 Tax=Phycisphaera mikurensis (strain NBRC 102666 / KCTC 22515 / FYK2301M01) TaxID=1142394 RepID=I0IFP8_PHYMF|nr:CpsB/CapC family capsule biosynthesis tyrosine phosphatase [Phycisphaera mikurensis]MBB6440524.1 protein-tyrosine phosphatase [Phycisphaera mikurensis]BAM04086.1 hypothetical protein PSMK_19270 [Phycisphaera mikurensis NBRC 102666]